MYIVVRCPRCGELLLANTDNRTRSCQKCNHRTDIRRLEVLGRTENPRDAVELMKQLKEKDSASEEYLPRFKRLKL